jgi:hypothetical protein
MKHRFPRKLKKKLKAKKLPESVVVGLRALSLALLNVKPFPKFPSGGVINNGPESILPIRHK